MSSSSKVGGLKLPQPPPRLRRPCLVCSENLSKRRKERILMSYGTILADLCRAVGVKVVKNLELFSDRVPVQFLRSKTLEFRGIFRSYLECDR